MTTNSRRRSLDGLRGFAAALVVLSHTKLHPFTEGFLGVDVFFVLSGFLITGLLISGRPRYRDFLARRAARLVPALLVALALVAVQQEWVGEFNGHCAAMSLTHTMDIHAFGADTCPGPWHITWSLAFEEQFYILWPLVLLLLVRRSPWKVAALLAGVWSVNAVRLAAFVPHEGPGGIRLLYAPDGRALSILLGCSVAFLVADERAVQWMRRHRNGYAWCALPGLALMIAPLIPHRERPGTWTTVVNAVGGDLSLTSAEALGTALVVLGLTWAGEHTPVARMLSFRPLVYVGTISYSLYLLHMVPLTIAKRTLPADRMVMASWVGIAAALVLATASRMLIEGPFQRRLVRVPAAGWMPPKAPARERVLSTV